MMLSFTDDFDMWVLWFYLFSKPFECTTILREGLSYPLLCFSCEDSLFSHVEISSSFPLPLHPGMIQISFHLSHLSAVCGPLFLPFQPWLCFFSCGFPKQLSFTSVEEPFLQPPNPPQPSLSLRNCLFWSILGHREVRAHFRLPYTNLPSCI